MSAQPRARARRTPDGTRAPQVPAASVAASSAPPQGPPRGDRSWLAADVLAKLTRYDHATCLVNGTIVRHGGEVRVRVGERTLLVTPHPRVDLPEGSGLAHAALWPRTDDSGLVTHWGLGKAQHLDAGAAGLLALSVCGTLARAGDGTLTVIVTPSAPGVVPFAVTCRAQRPLLAALPEPGGRLLVRGGVADGALVALRFHRAPDAPGGFNRGAPAASGGADHPLT